MSATARTISVLFFSILVMTGCVAPALSPPRARVAEISRLVVVAVEPPPLLVSGARLASSIWASSPGSAIIAETPPVRSAEGLVIFGGVVMLVEWVVSGKDPVARSQEKFLSDLPVLGARHRRDGIASAGSTVNNAVRCSMRRGDRPARARSCNLAYGRLTVMLWA